MSNYQLPASLADIESRPGTHRRGLKYLVYGGTKTGKSYMLASSPGPVLAAACGEPGIQPYLNPDRGDKVFDIETPDDYSEFLEFGIKNNQHFGSMVVDNMNLLWEDWMNWHQEELGVDQLQGKHWRNIKGPWKILLRRIMKNPIHFGAGVWLKDILYTEGAAAPGEKGKLEIVQQDNPQVEKTVPYAVDLIFKTDVERDRMFKPTNIHTVQYYGGRRPRCVPPEDLYTGKIWKFNSRKPVESVWQSVIGPFYEKWHNGEGATDFEGLASNTRERNREMNEAKEMESNELLGRLLSVIEADYDSLNAYAKAFRDLIEPEAPSLPQKVRDRLQKAHAAKKKELGG